MRRGMADSRWWLAHERGIEPHTIAWSLAESIWESQSSMRMNMARNAELYGADLSAFGLTTEEGFRRTVDNQFSVNVLANAVEAVQAKISKSPVLPMFVTTEGNYSEQRRARGLGRFVEGTFDENEMTYLDPQLVLDAILFGTAFLKVFEHNSRVSYERILPFEVLVDPLEARYGKPRTIYQRQYCDRLVLQEDYPDASEKLETSGEGDAWTGGANDPRTSDQVLVYEAWHLPSGPDAEDGRRIIFTDNATLIDEPWTESGFPFTALYSSIPLSGFWGQSMVTRMAPAQLEHNRLSEKIQRAHHLMGGAHFLIKKGSGFLPSQIDNDIGSIWEYDDAPPIPMVPQPLHPDVYAHRQRVAEELMQYSGVSQLSAASQKPAGLNSGKALETYHDIETERFLVFGKLREMFYVKVAELTVAAAKRIAANDESYTVKAKNKKFMEMVKWSDVDMERDKYTIQVFPTSQLARTPSARFDQVQGFAQAGLINSEEFKMLMDIPDFEQVNQRALAPRKTIERTLERIVDDGRYYPPMPNMNFDLAVQLGNQALSQAMLDGVEESTMDLLRQFISEATFLKQAAEPPPPPPAPPGPMPGEAPSPEAVPNAA